MVCTHARNSGLGCGFALLSCFTLTTRLIFPLGSLQEALPIKSTLIVMPANLLEQWQNEMDTHIAAGALTWCPLLMTLSCFKHRSPAPPFRTALPDSVAGAQLLLDETKDLRGEHCTQMHTQPCCQVHSV